MGSNFFPGHDDPLWHLRELTTQAEVLNLELEAVTALHFGVSPLGKRGKVCLHIWGVSGAD